MDRFHILDVMFWFLTISVTLTLTKRESFTPYSPSTPHRVPRVTWLSVSYRSTKHMWTRYGNSLVPSSTLKRVKSCSTVTLFQDENHFVSPLSEVQQLSGPSSPVQIKHLGPWAPLLLYYRSCSSRQIRQVTCALSERDTEPQLPVRPLETDASLSLVDRTRTAHRPRHRRHPAGIGLPTEAAPSSSLTLASAGRIKLSENPKVPHQHR